MSKGKLIVVCGIDGSGKGTQVKLIQQYFEKNNLKYSSFHFPKYGHNEFSEVIARYLRGEFGTIEEVNPYFVANIYAMDRYLFKSELEEALNKSDVVLLDRYVFSNVAYQSAKYKEGSEESKKIKKWIMHFEFNFLELPYPNLNIYFDVPIQVIKKRLEINRKGEDRNYLQGKIDIHEVDLEFQSRVRQNYIDSMTGTTNCKIIQCTESFIKENEEQDFLVFTPKELFNKYKKYLDYILFNKPI